jgi:hypothetical protein
MVSSLEENPHCFLHSNAEPIRRFVISVFCHWQEVTPKICASVTAQFSSRLASERSAREVLPGDDYVNFLADKSAPRRSFAITA